MVVFNYIASRGAAEVAFIRRIMELTQLYAEMNAKNLYHDFTRVWIRSVEEICCSCTNPWALNRLA